MGQDEPTQEKDALLSLLDRVQEDAKTIQESARTVASETTFSLDVAAGLREIVEIVRNDATLSPSDWQHLRSSWEAWRNVAGEVRAILGGAQRFALSAQATGVSTSTVLTAYSSQSWDPLRFLADPRPSVDRLGDVLAREAQREVVVAECVRLGLDRRPESSLSAVESLQEAYQALDQPSGEPSPARAVLLSLRESVESAIADLLRRRPAQEPAKSWRDKVTSIGRHCGRGGLAPGHFKRLGDDLESIIDGLSAAKQERCSRPEIIRRFHGGVLFMRAFLGSIDETLLRSGKGLTNR